MCAAIDVQRSPTGQGAHRLLQTGWRTANGRPYPCIQIPNVGASIARLRVAFSWFACYNTLTKVRVYYDQSAVRLPRHGINTGRKPLIYQAFSDFKL